MGGALPMNPHAIPRLGVIVVPIDEAVPNAFASADMAADGADNTLHHPLAVLQSELQTEPKVGDVSHAAVAVDPERQMVLAGLTVR